MKKLVCILMSLVLVFGLVGCGGNAATNENKEPEQKQEQKTEEKTEKKSENVLEKVKAQNKLIVGTSADYPPYEFHKMIDGKDQIVGFDINIVEEIAKDLGVELEVVDMDFSAILSAVETGMVDVGIGGINPTPDRDEQVDFSDIYFTSAYTVLVKKDKVDEFKTNEDLNGKIIGAQLGSLQEEMAHNEIEASNVVALGKVTDLALQLQSDLVDAIILEMPVAQSYAAQNENFAVAEGIKFEADAIEGGCVIIAANGEKEILEEVNKTIERLNNENKIEEYYADAVALTEAE